MILNLQSVSSGLLLLEPTTLDSFGQKTQAKHV